MTFAAREIEEALDNLRAAAGADGEIEVHENGGFLAELSPPQWEVREQGRNLIIHVWSSARNINRRVTALRDADGDHVVLEVSQFGRSRPGNLEFRRRDVSRARGRMSREKFRAQFGRMLDEKFPDARIELLTSSQDLKNSLSGCYPRGIMKEMGRTWAFLGASPSESPATIDGALAFGLIWLDYQRRRRLPDVCYGLRLILPPGAASSTLQRALALNHSAHLEIFEFDADAAQLKRLIPAELGNVQHTLPAWREHSALLGAAEPAISLVKNLIGLSAASLKVAALPAAREVVFRFRGLEFARWTSGEIQYGCGDALRILTPERHPDFLAMMGELAAIRNPESKQTRHWLYRAAPERWLETQIMENLQSVDASLDSRFLYPQVAPSTISDRGVVDLVGVTQKGRLVLMELKASEDIQLPLQALDYWIRVRRLHAAGEFSRLGYFSGVELDTRPPLLWLIAPGLQFHPTTDVLLGFASPEVNVTHIGINENWRQSLAVIFRRQEKPVESSV